VTFHNDPRLVFSSEETVHNPPRVKTNFSINRFSKIIQLLPKCKSLTEVYPTYPASSCAAIAVFQAKGSQASSTHMKNCYQQGGGKKKEVS